MSQHRPIRRLTAWLSMLVLVLHALMPLAAQAMLASAGQVDTVEICTSTGMVRVAVDQPHDHSKSKPAQSCEPCIFCLLSHGHAGLPPVSRVLPLLSLGAEMPPAFYQAARTPAVWLSALSRGPPFLS